MNFFFSFKDLFSNLSTCTRLLRLVLRRRNSLQLLILFRWACFDRFAKLVLLPLCNLLHFFKQLCYDIYLLYCLKLASLIRSNRWMEMGLIWELSERWKAGHCLLHWSELSHKVYRNVFVRQQCFLIFDWRIDGVACRQRDWIASWCCRSCWSLLLRILGEIVWQYQS